MEKVLLAISILLPALSAALCYFVRKSVFRNIVVVLTALVMFTVAGGFVYILTQSGGSIAINLESEILPWIIKALDIILLLYVAYKGFQLRKYIVDVLVVLQLIPLVAFEFIGHVSEPHYAFVIDYLTLVMILLVSIIGPVITIFAIGYMKEHEHHLGLSKSRQPRFFAILFIFLAAMNALVMTNNLLWMYLFWEITTLCSFWLISHDGNSQAVQNGLRALILNMIGGVGFIIGIIMIYQVKGTVAIDELLTMSLSGPMLQVFPVGVALLMFAGFTKSAQFPFQSWLLGAMVAPTPVSALLHSSTMVKAGVYIVVRFAPIYAGTKLGTMISVVGGFTFLVGSAIAISQSNAKRVLAYSTIANLGLIICCAGLGSKVAIGAAVLLMIFHAVSKGLLFLCVGTIEQGIGSRDIEDMQGLMKRMPFTTVITVIGIISMLLPPFGVLVTKWLAIEAAVSQPLVLLMIVLGSAFTVVFWAKWLGIILTMSYKPKYKKENLHFSIKFSLGFIFAFVFICSILIQPMYNLLIQPYMAGIKIQSAVLNAANGGIIVNSLKNVLMGSFSAVPVFILMFVIIFTIPFFLKLTGKEKVRPPYLCGENRDNDVRGLEFTSPGDKAESAIVHNFYLNNVFGENKLTLWANLIAICLILVMFGVVI